MTPNQSKSTTDSIKDTVTGTYDKAARYVSPIALFLMTFPLTHFLALQ